VSQWVCALGALAVSITVATSAAAQQEPATPAFKSAVERVAITAIVRDSKGKMVKDLTARDFELVDSGRSRPLINVWSEPSPASVAILMDASGSMATKMDRARATADLFIAGMQNGVDELALYSCDVALGCDCEHRRAYFRAAATPRSARHHRRRRFREQAEALRRLGDRKLAGRSGVHRCDRIFAGRRIEGTANREGSARRPCHVDWWRFAARTRHAERLSGNASDSQGIAASVRDRVRTRERPRMAPPGAENPQRRVICARAKWVRGWGFRQVIFQEEQSCDS